jgi:OPA family glycerol-3-phosphate transporter-like MFS transporter
MLFAPAPHAARVAIGLSAFLMGAVSDRSTPRFSLAAGLPLSARLTLATGLAPWALSSIPAMVGREFASGWVQGMSWPRSSRAMIHCCMQRERGTVVSARTISHNVGVGMIGPLFHLGRHLFGDWHSAFDAPAAVAVMLPASSVLHDHPHAANS